MICWADSMLSISCIQLQVDVSIGTLRHAFSAWVAPSAIAWTYLVGAVTMPTAHLACFCDNAIAVRNDLFCRGPTSAELQILRCILIHKRRLPIQGATQDCTDLTLGEDMH